MGSTATPGDCGPPAGQATARQLVIHTTGLSYWFWNADIVKWEAATGIPNVLSGLNLIFQAPMVVVRWPEAR
jgi:hypothetical protein